MSPHPDEPDDRDAYRSVTDLLERPPVPINWNLLDAAERRALARLALLADGFTLLPALLVLGSLFLLRGYRIDEAAVVAAGEVAR